MTRPAPLILASQSPRRAQLLSDAGFYFEQRSPPFADPDQPPVELNSDQAEAYAQSLAVDKAYSLAAVLDEPAVILAADTICVDRHGAVVGKPTDHDHAGAMLRGFVNHEHRVITGVALLRVAPGQDRAMCSFADVATVRFGQIESQQLTEYLATGEWQGKAGGYNLFDRQAAGWPITVEGDPTTVVGLPMGRLVSMLDSSLNSGL